MRIEPEELQALHEVICLIDFGTERRDRLASLEEKIKGIAQYWFIPINIPAPAKKETTKSSTDGKENTMNVQTIKTLNMDRVLDIDEAVALSAEVRAFETEYEALGMPIPDWLVKSADVLREEIARRTKASKLAELKKLENEIEGYKSATEKRNEATKRLAALQNELGMSPAKSGR